MEADDLKSYWKSMEPVSRDKETLQQMLQENQHPVLKSIRKQILFEITGWVLFLVVYYSMFDGAEKPFWVNLSLIMSLLFPIFHSLYGYYYNKYLTNNLNVKIALEKLYIRIKKYALLSIISRLSFVSGLLLFFTYNIHFTTAKYFLLLFLGGIISIQLVVLYRIWNRRIIQIRDCIDILENVR